MSHATFVFLVLVPGLVLTYALCWFVSRPPRAVVEVDRGPLAALRRGLNRGDRRG